MTSPRRYVRTAIGLVACALVTAAPSAAADEGSAFTLDGQSVSRAVAEQANAGCAALPAADGTVACFSTERRHNLATLRALQEGALPPGYEAMPDKATTGRLLLTLRAQTGAGSASKKKSATARAADSCAANDTHVYTGTSKGGSQTWYGLILTWPNFSSTFNNTVSSYWASNFWIPTWHDGGSGTGDYYDLAYTCREVQDLSNGSWDNRFTSYHAQ